MRLPPPETLPPAVPSRGTAFTRLLGRLVLGLLGWRLEGTYPDRSKFVLVGAPHTSNWDAVVGLSAAAAYGLEVHFFAKREAFRGPVGWLLRAFGGIPVDRSRPGGLVGDAIEEFHRRDAFLLGMTPEGTRGRSDRWKTGFYRIARAVDVPIVLIPLDYRRKVIGPGPTLHLTDDLAADLRRIVAYFDGVEGKNPELYARPAPDQLMGGDGDGEAG